MLKVFNLNLFNLKKALQTNETHFLNLSKLHAMSVILPRKFFCMSEKNYVFHVILLRNSLANINVKQYFRKHHLNIYDSVVVSRFFF